MDIEEARALIKATDRDITQNQEIFRGLQILARYDNDIRYAFEHDQMYCNNFEETIEQMTSEEVKLMAQLGWFEEEESWSHF